MRNIFAFLKNKAFEISTILCFILPPVGVLLLLIFSINAIIKAWKSKQIFPLSLISFFFMCLFISTIGSVIIQMNRPFLLVDSLMILLYWGIYLRIVSNSSVDSFHHFKWIMIFGGIYNIIIGWISKLVAMPLLLQLLLGTKLVAERIPKNYTRLIGSSYNPNFTMHLLVIALALLFAELLNSIRKKKWFSVIWQIVILLVLSNGVLATGSRAGFMLMIGLYFIFFFQLNKVLFLITAVVTFFQSKHLLQLMPRNDIIDSSFQVREDIWSNGIEIWKQHLLFGTTPHGFRFVYLDLFKQGVPHSHNIFIGFFAEYGLVGGIAFLILLAATIYNLIYLYFNTNKSKTYFEYFLFSIPLIVLTGILDEPTFSPQTGVLSIMLLAYWDRYLKTHVKYNPIQELTNYLFFKKKPLRNSK